MKNWSIKLGAYRAKNEPEKLVLPGVIFCNASHPSFSDSTDGVVGGFVVAVGWWDFCVKLTVLWIKESDT